MWGAHDGMGWWMVFGSVLWLLFWAAIVYVVVVGLGRFERRGEPDAAEIARRRYARGELSEEQFERIRRGLSEQ